MNEHLISVIIPVYNTAEYLPRCLDSVLNNTYRDLEVICINDGSRDGSLGVLNAYAAKDCRIRVIDQENAGVSAARNRGLDEATGEYIAFVDSDDWVHRQYFEVLHKITHESNADISVCAALDTSQFVEDQAIATESVTQESLSKLSGLQKSLAIWGRLYRRHVIGSHRFAPGIRLAEDTLFNLHLLDRAHYTLRLAYCDCRMYYYFMRGGSAVHSLNPRELEPLINWYVSHLDSVPDSCVRNYYLIEALKNLFSWRYSVMFLPKPDENQRIQNLIVQCAAMLHRSRAISTATRLLYGFMAYVPVAYRLFRIIHDPTMLGWEKQQREKAKAERNT